MAPLALFLDSIPVVESGVGVGYRHGEDSWGERASGRTAKGATAYTVAPLLPTEPNGSAANYQLRVREASLEAIELGLERR
ncbi:MAG: hypothetical protein KBF43_11730, partial [Dermatophilaceae bacterium]|nr:hypothetical protein [Dermatophilaceae bacterium]